MPSAPVRIIAPPPQGSVWHVGDVPPDVAPIELVSIDDAGALVRRLGMAPVMRVPLGRWEECRRLPGLPGEVWFSPAKDLLRVETLPDKEGRVSYIDSRGDRGTIPLLDPHFCRPGWQLVFEVSRSVTQLVQAIEERDDLRERLGRIREIAGATS